MKENKSNTSVRQIEFTSQGATLRGRFYLPDANKHTFPVVIMAHGFTTTINGMTADKYAEEFQKAGSAVLLYDHRNFGISDGEPRQEINFWVQARGYIDAISYLSALPEIDTDKIAVWGASMSAREAFTVACLDKRVKALINIIPAYGDDLPSEDKDGQALAFANRTILADNIKDLPHTTTDQMPVVSSDQFGVPSRLVELTAFRWFIEYGGRFGTNWQNVVSMSAVDSPEQFHVGQLAKNLEAAVLMIVAENDEMSGASPVVARKIFSAIDQPKKWIDIDGGHFGLLYYPSELFEKAKNAQIDFLRTHLLNSTRA